MSMGVLDGSIVTMELMILLHVNVVLFILLNGEIDLLKVS